MGCFCKFGVLFVGVLTIRVLLLAAYGRALALENSQERQDGLLLEIPRGSYTLI